jgi:photosystem II stability/assembly factor-like uncharacterized protein
MNKHKASGKFIGIIFQGFIITLIVLSVSLLPSQHSQIVYAGKGYWTTTGPYGAMIRAVAIAPNNNQVIYAGVYNGTRKVLKSSDAGATWAPSETGLETAGNAQNFAFDPVNPAIVYFASSTGLYKSSDAGNTWILKSDGQANGIKGNLAPWWVSSSPVDGTLFLTNSMLNSSLPAGIYRSKDSGDTWDLVFPNAGWPTVITVAPSAPNIIYCGSLSAGIFKSVNGGDTWQEIDSSFGSLPFVTSMLVDAHDAQVVYLGVSQNGIFKTTNGGQSWAPIGTDLGSINVDNIIVDPLNQQEMYVGGGDIGISGTTSFGVFHSTDNTGQSWVAMNSGMGNRSVYSLAIDTASPQNIYAGTSNGVWKYTVSSAQKDYSVSIADGALYTNQTSVTLSLNAPPLTSQMMISNDGGFGGAIWEPFSTQKSWTISAYGANAIPRIVYAKFMTSGHISGQYQDDIILDQTSPTGSIQIIAPAAAAVPDPRFNIRAVANLGYYPIYLPLVCGIKCRPGYNLIGLTLSASDDLSGVGEMILSNDGNFTDAKWQVFAKTLEWWVSDSTSTTVNVKFRDRAGNISPVYSASTLTP